MDRAPTKQTVDIRREVKSCATCKRRFTRDAGFCPFDGTKLEIAPFDPLADPLIGARVDGRYDVVSTLGEGGMGRIYEVRHAALGRPFAMKVLRPDLAQDEDLAARFIREARATASVKHPNVVQITDFGRLPDGVPFFVMELLVGHTLGEIIKAVALPPARAVRILRKVAGALSAAHAAGVVHRDLKPDNIFLVGGSRDPTAVDPSVRARSLAQLSSGAEVRVVDFGAAKFVGDTRLTRAGVVFGTPHYMSPEQAGDQPVDGRADVYSLGVIMYEMFCGKVPFEAETYMGVLTQHMFSRPTRPSEVPGAARELGELEDITMRCLAKRPEERFASMDDLIASLDQAAVPDGEADADLGPRVSLTGGGVSRSRPPMPLAFEPPTLAEIRRSIDGPEASQARRRGRWLHVLYAAAGGVLLLSLGAVGWSLFRHDPATAAPVARPAPAIPAKDPVAVPLPPTPPVAPSSAPSVGEGAPVPTRPLPPPTHYKARPDSELDDVGDPFARH